MRVRILLVLAALPAIATPAFAAEPAATTPAATAPAPRRLSPQNKHSKETKYPTYDGLVMAGYQGWFNVAGNGMMYPNGNGVRIDMWPDVTEYKQTYPTGLKLADGTTARFFNSADKSTVDLHFKWMKDYGLDGVFMQRFLAPPNPTGGRAPKSCGTPWRPPGKRAGDLGDVRPVRPAQSRRGRHGHRRGLEVPRRRTEGDQPARHEDLSAPSRQAAGGHRGVGFPDRGYDIKNIKLAELIDWFHNDPQYGGCWVMLGVPTFWRDPDADLQPRTVSAELIKKATW